MTQEEEDDENLRLSAARTLESFVKVCDKRVIDSITGAVAKIINSEVTYHHQATVFLFSTISEYSDKKLIVNIFADCFDDFFALLKGQNTIVVKNSLIGFIRLSDSLPEIFLRHQKIEEFIETIYSFMNVVDVKDIS